MPLPQFETYDEILEGMVARVVTNSPLSDVANSSALMTILAAAARSDSKIAFEALKILQLFSIDTCTGDELERRAAEIFPTSVGGAIERRPATNAVGSVRFARVEPGVAIAIPRGIVVKTSSGIQFRTTDPVTIDAADLQSPPVKVVALEPGAEGNVAGESITVFATRPQGINTVSNEDATRFGEDRESDDSFRARIKLWLQSLDHCTVGAIEAAVLGARDAETDSVVRFVKVIEYPINPGYADCFIDDGTGTVGINDRRNVTNENVTDYSGNTSSGVAQGGEEILYLKQKPIATIFEMSSSQRGVLTEGTDFFVNPANGQVQFAPALVAGERITASYTYFVGLIAEAQKIIEGDPQDRQAYPGYRAAGCSVVVRAPVLTPVDVMASLVVENGYDADEARFRAEEMVTRYLNTLGIGADVVFYEVVAQMMEVPGVIDVRNMLLNDDTTNIPVAPQNLPRARMVDID